MEELKVGSYCRVKGNVGQIRHYFPKGTYVKCIVIRDYRVIQVPTFIGQHPEKPAPSPLIQSMLPIDVEVVDASEIPAQTLKELDEFVDSLNREDY